MGSDQPRLRLVSVPRLRFLIGQDADQHPVLSGWVLRHLLVKPGMSRIGSGQFPNLASIGKFLGDTGKGQRDFGRLAGLCRAPHRRGVQAFENLASLRCHVRTGLRLPRLLTGRHIRIKERLRLP